MYVLYLDESGDPNAWHGDQRHFVLGGVAVHEGQIDRLSKLVDDIQTRFLPPSRYGAVSRELHASEIHGGRAFADLGDEGREKLLDAVYQCISNAWFPNLIPFAAAVHQSAVETPEQTLSITLESICARFNLFLKYEYERDSPSKGLIVFDEKSLGTERECRRLVRDFKRHGGTWFGYLGNVVDIPYFANSRDTRMMQLADFVVYAVFRYYEKSDDVHLNTILQAFEKKAKELRPGLIHITRQRCSCVACRR